MGDFDAKIGSDNRGYEDNVRQQGLLEMNNNKEIFADPRAAGNRVIGGSFVQYRWIHQATWASPD